MTAAPNKTQPENIEWRSSTGRTHLHADFDEEDCWIQITDGASAAEIAHLTDQIEAAGLVFTNEEGMIVPIPNGFKQYLGYGKGLMGQLGMWP